MPCRFVFEVKPVPIPTWMSLPLGGITQGGTAIEDPIPPHTHYAHQILMFNLLSDEGTSTVGTVNHQDVQLLLLGEGRVMYAGG